MAGESKGTDRDSEGRGSQKSERGSGRLISSKPEWDGLVESIMVSKIREATFELLGVSRGQHDPKGSSRHRAAWCCFSYYTHCLRLRLIEHPGTKHHNICSFNSALTQRWVNSLSWTWTKNKRFYMIFPWNFFSLSECLLWWGWEPKVNTHICSAET